MTQITAEIIRKARHDLRETQAAFAERFGVNQSTIHHWETEGLPARGGPSCKLVELVLQAIGALGDK